MACNGRSQQKRCEKSGLGFGARDGGGGGDGRRLGMGAGSAWRWALAAGSLACLAACAPDASGAPAAEVPGVRWILVPGTAPATGSAEVRPTVAPGLRRDELIGALRGRLGALLRGSGTFEVREQGAERVEVIARGTELDRPRLRALLTSAPRFEIVPVLRVLRDGVPSGEARDGEPGENRILRNADAGQGEGESLVLQLQPLLTGASLERAAPARDPLDRFVLSFQLDAEGTAAMRRWTRENIGRRLALLIDGRVMAAPVVRAEIGSSGQIEGDFSEPELQDLALALTHRIVAAPVIEQETVLEEEP